MSGRSAYVRKEKTKVKDGGHGGSENGRPSSINGDLPLRSSGKSLYSHRDTTSRSHGEHTIPKTSLDDTAYARARKPQVPVLDVSGIEKSSFRSLMDKKSEDVRNGLAKTFGRKKKEETPRPHTARAAHPDGYDTAPSQQNFSAQPQVVGGTAMASPRQEPHHPEMPEYIRTGPPQGKLPPIPQGPQLKRWLGGGKPAQPWNKLRKDPELWDANGDTLIYFSHEDHHSPRPQASFRVSSHVLESTESRYFITALREGSTENSDHFNRPPSPIDSLAMGVPQHNASTRYNHTPPRSENSINAYDGQISYELYFPPPSHLSRTDAIRHQVGTRNVLAILYQVSLVGINFVQALKDVQDRLETYMPSSVDIPSMVVDYIVSKDMDDIRNNPSLAAAVLAWSEGETVRWEEAWRESFVHCVGMHSKVESCPEFRFVTPITRALMERASLEMQVRIHSCESRLFDLDFEDMFTEMKPIPSSIRKAVDGLRVFYIQYYKKAYGSWPPAPPSEEEQWLTREHAQRLQADFGALYNFLVNRDVVWDCGDASAGRKWNMVHPGKRSFEADTPDLPLTDILVAFDDKHNYQHIPHPYPLVSQSAPLKRPKDIPNKVSKKGPKPIDEKMAEKMAALAYTESTNIYLLGSDFVSNDMVDQFVKLEKADMTTGSDPVESRRARWVLIYGILQTLATVSVDTPNLHFTDVSYHLSANLRGTPPWKRAPDNVGGAEHTGSYCWMISDTWTNYESYGKPLLDADPDDVSRVPTRRSNRRGFHSPSRYSRASSASAMETGSARIAPVSPLGSFGRHHWWKNSDRDGLSTTGYGPGIEKVEDWPPRETSPPSDEQIENRYRDFDDHAM
jgi:hypothetical protein